LGTTKKEKIALRPGQVLSRSIQIDFVSKCTITKFSQTKQKNAHFKVLFCTNYQNKRDIILCFPLLFIVEEEINQKKGGKKQKQTKNNQQQMTPKKCI